MAKKRTPPRDSAQMKRDAARLHAMKGAVMRDMEAMHEAMPAKPKGRQKRAHRGIHMGSK